MTDVTGVPFEVLSDVLSDPAAVLFGLEAEFNVVRVERTGPAAVKLIIEQAAREGPRPACGVFSAAVKERPVSRVKDLPASGQQVELWWRKRRLWCREVLSPRRAFIQTSAAVKPRARTTERPRDKIASAIAGSNRPVSDVAAEYQVSWTTGASGVDQRGGEVVAGAGADIAAGDR
jgi:transposase